MKEMIDKSRIALERESIQLCVQEGVFGTKTVAKKHSRYEGSSDPKESVLTPADLIAFATSPSRGIRGAIPFTRKDSVFIFVTVILVFKTTSYANAFANYVNEHASGNSWSYGEPVLAWIPKKGTIDSIVAGVAASRDISIQEWAKSQNSRKHAASSGEGEELTQDAGPIKSPKKKAKKVAPKQDAKHVRIAMDVDEESAHESVAFSDSPELIETDATKTSPFMKDTDNFIQKTMGHAMAQLRNQFATHSHRIDGLDRDVKENMRMTKKIGGKLDNHLINLLRQYKGLADDIVGRINGRESDAVDKAGNCISSPTPAPQPTRKTRGPRTVDTKSGHTAKAVRSTSRTLQQRGTKVHTH